MSSGERVVSRLFWSVVLLFAPALSWGAGNTCIRYSSEGELAVALDFADQNLLDKAKQSTQLFIDLAQTGQAEKVLRQFSRLDGSRAFETRKTREIAGLYDSYPGISSFSYDLGFSWGPYIVAWGDYTHTRGQAKILDATICTSLCQVSNVFERPEEPEDLVSRYMSLQRNADRPLTSCPKSEPAFEVLPSAVSVKGSPLKVYFNKSVKAVRVAGIFPQLDQELFKKKPDEARKIARCDSLVRAANNLMGMSQDQLRSVVGDFVTHCTVNMTETSITPAVQIGTRLEKINLTSVALLGNLNQASNIKRFFSLRDGKWTLEFYRFDVSIEGDLPKYIVLPFVEVDGVRRIDWAYYGYAPGEMLSSAAFARYLDKLAAKATP